MVMQGSSLLNLQRSSDLYKHRSGKALDVSLWVSVAFPYSPVPNLRYITRTSLLRTERVNYEVDWLLYDGGGPSDYVLARVLPNHTRKDRENVMRPITNSTEAFALKARMQVPPKLSRNYNSALECK